MLVLTAHAQNSSLKTPCWRTATTPFQRDDCKTRNGTQISRLGMSVTTQSGSGRRYVTGS